MSTSQLLLTVLVFLLPLLLIARAFLLSRKSKGWYGLSVAGMLYVFGASWGATAVLALANDNPTAAEALRSQIVPAGLPLFVALILCSELLYWAPGLAKKGWLRWKSFKVLPGKRASANRG